MVTCKDAVLRLQPEPAVQFASFGVFEAAKIIKNQVKLTVASVCLIREKRRVKTRKVAGWRACAGEKNQGSRVAFINRNPSFLPPNLRGKNGPSAVTTSGCD